MLRAKTLGAWLCLSWERTADSTSCIIYRLLSPLDPPDNNWAEMYFILLVSFTVYELLIVNWVLLKSSALHTSLLNIQLCHLFCSSALLFCAYRVLLRFLLTKTQREMDSPECRVMRADHRCSLHECQPKIPACITNSGTACLLEPFDSVNASHSSLF